MMTNPFMDGVVHKSKIFKILKDFNAETIRLEQNYRSTGNILKSANQRLSNNSDRLGKNLWTDGEMGSQ